MVDYSNNSKERNLFVNESFSLTNDIAISIGDLRIATALRTNHSMKVIVTNVFPESYVSVIGVHTYPDMQTDQDIRVNLFHNTVFDTIFIQKDILFYVWNHQLGPILTSVTEEEIIASMANIGERKTEYFDSAHFYKQEQIHVAREITKECTSFLLQSSHRQTVFDPETKIEIDDGR